MANALATEINQPLQITWRVYQSQTHSHRAEDNERGENQCRCLQANCTDKTQRLVLPVTCLFLFCHQLFQSLHHFPGALGCSLLALRLLLVALGNFFQVAGQVAKTLAQSLPGRLFQAL